MPDEDGSGRLDSVLEPDVVMPGWQSLVLKVAIGVILLDAAAVALRASGVAPAVLTAVYALATAGVGWLIASYMMLRALSTEEREHAAARAASTAKVPATAEVPATFESPAPARKKLAATGPTGDKAWAHLVEECVELVEELDRARAGFDPARRELTAHVILRLEEILDQPGVEVISGERIFARDRHKTEGKASAGANIAETLSPGFALGRRILLRARVRLEGGGERG